MFIVLYYLLQVKMNNRIFNDIVYYLLWILYPMAYFMHIGLFRGKQQGCFYQSTTFLILLRLYVFSLFWLPVYYFLPTVAKTWAILYLPFYLDLSEITGERRSEYLKRSGLARFMAWFFNAQIVKTVNIDPGASAAILAVHHHGLLPFASTITLGTEARGYSELFPALRDRVEVAATFLFFVPFWRDLCLMASIVDVNKWVFEKFLRQGTTVVVYPGGAREAQYAYPDSDVIDLRRKQGFLKLSIKHNAPVVPVFSFNETDYMYQLTYDTAKRRFPLLFFSLQAYNKATGIMMPMLFNIMPKLRAPIVTVVGAPILYNKSTGKMVVYDASRPSSASSLSQDSGLAFGEKEEEPSDADVERFSEQYIEHLHRFYSEYAPLYNSKPGRELVIYS